MEHLLRVMASLFRGGVPVYAYDVTVKNDMGIISSATIEARDDESAKRIAISESDSAIVAVKRGEFLYYA